MDDLYYWEQHATIFDTFIGEEGDALRQLVLDPFLFKKINAKTTDIVLDAGCGNGYLSRKLSPQVKQVYALDGAQKMIDIAKEKSSKFHNITYQVQDLTKTPWSIKEACNHIVTHLVLQDLDCIDTVLEECSKNLTNEGVLHISIPHPFTSPPTATYVLGLSGRLGISKGHLKVYSYMEERKTQRDIYLHKEIKHNYYHRTISTYLNTLIKHKFQIQAVHEIGTDEEFIKKHPEYAHGRAIPIFLYIKSKKL